jgi:hypothetical protein
MRRSWRMLMCLLGWHEWRSDGDSYIAAYSGRLTTMTWHYCPHCYETKLKFICRD